MKFWTTMFGLAILIFLFIHTVVLAAEPGHSQCSKMGSPEATAIQYQLYAAFQTGFDGYEAPCEFQCLGNKPCQKSCQSKEALRLLRDKLIELAEGKSLQSCPTIAKTCIQQCEHLGPPCQETCQHK